MKIMNTTTIVAIGRTNTMKLINFNGGDSEI